jgi:adenine-specific DNA methylase
MTDSFKEAHRILRDDGVLTVMFTHKKQEAWAALFESLIAAGFTITATWPVQTESQHSLHQANKNAAQSTVILSSRKREAKAGKAYFEDIKDEIHQRARDTAARLDGEGLNRVDQMVGAFGPGMEVFSRYDAVRTIAGEPFTVAQAIQEAADAVAQWRVEQLAQRGLEGVDPASRFALLCWDVLAAAEFRFNEAKLLGHAVGMDVDSLKTAGLVSATGDKVKMLTAKERRRDKPVRNEVDLFGVTTAGKTKGRARVSRKVHPNDEAFASAIDAAHALALRHAEAGGGQAGIGSAKSLALNMKWGPDSPVARLMQALCVAAPHGVRFAGKGKKRTAADDFPEFRAWHSLLKPLFGIDPPEWKEPVPTLTLGIKGATQFDDDEDSEEDEGGEAEE